MMRVQTVIGNRAENRCDCDTAFAVAAVTTVTTAITTA